MARDRIALVLRHVRHEGLGAFAGPIATAGYAVRTLDVAERALGSEVRQADLVIAVGGPMGAYETAANPWLEPEIEALRERINRDAPTLGICLGGQLIAAALGARVYPGPSKEVGFAPLTLTDDGAASPLRHLADVPILHWHGDTFDLPAGVTLLASSALYANQAFARGPRLLALQCHPEMGLDDGFASWLVDAEAYVEEAGTNIGELAGDYARLGPMAAEAGQRLLTEWLRTID